MSKIVRLFTSVMLVLFLANCGGSGGASDGGSLPPPIPTGSVAGTAHDNVLVGSTITAYDYSTGAKGAVLGTATTNDNGNYSLSLQVETRPVLLEATGGYYVEEASEYRNGTTHRRQVNLQDGQVLQAVVNYSTGSAITTQLTVFTHLAAGLASYRIKTGTAVASAISSANSDISSFIGFNIVTVKPLDVTNSNNATAFPTNGHLYGFLSAAISDWTMYVSNQNGQTTDNNTMHTYYNSINFAQLAFNDIVADGVLDGMGLDNTNQPVHLSFGIVPITAHVYRHALAAHMIQFADTSPNNATGITGGNIGQYAANTSQYSGTIFGNNAPIAFTNNGKPVLSITPFTSPSWIRKIATVNASVSTQGTSSNVFAIDGNNIAASSLTFTFDTHSYTDGTHSLTLNALDSYGLISAASISVNIDNTPPTLPTLNQTHYATYYSPWVTVQDGSFYDFSISGTASDASPGSGVSYVTINSGLTNATTLSNGIPDASGNWTASFSLPAAIYTLSEWVIIGFDNAGNCVCYQPVYVSWGAPYNWVHQTSPSANCTAVCPDAH